jgi:hypothetical protein
MSRFLLPCPLCQASISVGIAQAGSSMPCPSCGKVVDVPGTRQLRLLPADSLPNGVGKQASGTSDGNSLGFRLLLASLLLFGSLCLTYGGWLAYDRWRSPIVFGHTEDEFFQGLYDESMAEPIAQSWEHWNYLVDVGLPEESEPLPYFQISRYYEERKPWMVGSLASGALLIATFLGLSFSTSRRRPR